MEHSRYQRGYTLIELTVVLAIIVIITSVVISSHSAFNKTVILSNTAYDIALTLRSTQTFGLSSRGLNTERNVGYGLHIEGVPASSFILFADTVGGGSCSGGTPACYSGDFVYTSAIGESDVRVQSYTLGNGMTIKDFCTQSGGSGWRCSSDSSIALTSLDIVFERPNPDAFMSENSSYDVFSPVTKACLRVTSSQGGDRYISVAQSGQIIANAASCP